MDGTPKLVHHAVRRAFAPLLLSAVRTPSERGSPAGQIEVHVTSDLTAAASGALTIDVLRWADAPAVPAANLSLRVAAPPLGSSLVWRGDVGALLAAAKTDAPSAFLRLTLDYSLGVDGAERRAAAPRGAPPARAVSYMWLSAPKEAGLPPAAPAVSSVAQLADDRARVTLTSSSTAAFVSLESSTLAGAFSDGAFMLLAGQSAEVDFVGRAPFAAAALRASLRVRSLRDTYE